MAAKILIKAIEGNDEEKDLYKTKFTSFYVYCVNFSQFAPFYAIFNKKTQNRL
jgi:hypothetical protein